MQQLKEFLIKAKKQTYANKNIENGKSSRLNSCDYEYTDGTMIYHDTYFGGINFIGEEIVYDKSNKPIWGMNYYGVILEEELSEEVFNNVLRPALMNVGQSNVLPVRGPRKFVNGEYKYVFDVKGNLNNFYGEEVITKGEERVYYLKCHGGIIKL